MISMKVHFVCLVLLPLLASGEDIGGLGSVRTRPLDAAERYKWREDGGHWKFEADSLTGVGDSRITYMRTYLPPFRLTCDIEVLDCIRPQIHFGRYWFGNEGTERDFEMYPFSGQIQEIHLQDG